MSERTLPALLEASVEKFADNILMWEKTDKEYKGSTYSEIQQSVYRTAAGLLTLGIEKGDRVALVSEGRNDWVISELAILYTGAINVPLSVKLQELSELKFRTSHSGCRFAIVSGSQAHKVLKIKKIYLI